MSIHQRGFWFLSRGGTPQFLGSELKGNLTTIETSIGIIIKVPINSHSSWVLSCGRTFPIIKYSVQALGSSL